MDATFWDNFYGQIFKDNNIVPGSGGNLSSIPANLAPNYSGVGQGPGSLNAIKQAFGLLPKPTADGSLPQVEITAPGAQWTRDRLDESGLQEVPFGEGGIPGAIGDFIGRGAIIILGMIFVAVGLAMFKPGLVVAAGEGFRDGAVGALTDA